MDFLNEYKLKEVLGKYSQFIQYPIYIKVKKEVEAEDDEDDEEDEDEDKDETEAEDDDEKKEEKKKEPKEKKKTTVYEWDQVLLAIGFGSAFVRGAGRTRW